MNAAILMIEFAAEAHDALGAQVNQEPNAIATSNISISGPRGPVGEAVKASLHSSQESVTVLTASGTALAWSVPT